MESKMRLAVLALCVLAPCAGLGACAALEETYQRYFGPREAAPAPIEYDRAAMTLSPVDAATNLLSWGPLTVERATPKSAPAGGEDPPVKLTLTRGDGKAMSFETANHAPADLMVQAAGGPLAQAMGLFGQETPELFHSVPAEGDTTFLCPPDGPRAIGLYENPNSTVLIIALRDAPDLAQSANSGGAPPPISPDSVCARMRFVKG
jgi:hypothetical protein